MSRDIKAFYHEANLKLLQSEIEKLRAQNKNYLQTINCLSNEILLSRKRNKKRQKCKTKKKKAKVVDGAVETKCALGLPIKSNKTDDIETGLDKNLLVLPLEVFMYIFQHLNREDLDCCELVCKKWHKLINDQAKKFLPRVIRSVKFIEKSYLSLTISTKNVTKKYSFSLGDHESSEVVFDCLKRLLKNAVIKRMIFCNLNISDEFCRKLAKCFKSIQLPEISRIEMLAVNLNNISPDQFHKLLGHTIVSTQYFLDGVRNALEDHFSTRLFEQPAIRRADDITIYDVRSLDNDDIVLAIGDDTLISLIFGADNQTKRNTLYLDSPDISPNFLQTCLLKFIKCENVDQIISHVEFAHCHEQQVQTLKDIGLEYEHDIQVEWSARNEKTDRVMEGRVSRNGDNDNFCHLTLSIQNE